MIVSREALWFACALLGCSGGRGPRLERAAPETPFSQDRSPETASIRAADASKADRPRTTSGAEPLLEGCPEATPSLTGWTQLFPDSVSPDEKLSLNYSGCEWAVRLDESGRVAPSSYEEKIPMVPPGLRLPAEWGPPRKVEQRASGVLVGFNQGEWGGALVWYSNDRTTARTLLMENVVEIVSGPRSVIALVGLAHLGADRGRAVEVVEDDGVVKVGRAVDLGSAPRAFFRESTEAILVATTVGLVRLTSDLAVREVIKTRWSMLYPNSLVVDAGGVAYVGMRGVIAKVTTVGNPSEEWLFPPRSPRKH
jgi:hypothetical protein